MGVKLSTMEGCGWCEILLYGGRVWQVLNTVLLLKDEAGVDCQKDVAAVK